MLVIREQITDNFEKIIDANNVQGVWGKLKYTWCGSKSKCKYSISLKYILLNESTLQRENLSWNHISNFFSGRWMFSFDPWKIKAAELITKLQEMGSVKTAHWI